MEASERKVFVGSDRAGCIRSRQSTSGAIARLGKHTLRMWSTTQPMSSAEAEFYTMVEGATRGVGLKAILCEMDVIIGIVGMHADSSAAKSFASRCGLGNVRHISVK